MKYIIACFGSIAILSCGQMSTSNNPMLTASNILSVRPDMTMDQVQAILGMPVRKDSVANYCFYCSCKTNHLCIDSMSYTFQYTKQLKFRLSYPMLWIHFDSKMRVKSVYVKKYNLLDDEAIYGFVKTPCDTSIIGQNIYDVENLIELGSVFPLK